MKDFESIKQYIVKDKNIFTIIGLSVIVVISILLIIVRCIQDDNTSDVVVQTPTEVVGTVCIDAGHGGSDTGAISPDGSLYEKDDNLKLALKVKEYLESMNLNVVMTRTDDTYVVLNERCKIANTNNVDLFVSLHK